MSGKKVKTRIPDSVRKLPHEMHPGAHQDTLQLVGRNAIVMRNQLAESIHGRKMTDIQRAAMMISDLQERNKELAEKVKNLAEIGRKLTDIVESLESENAELRKKLNDRC